MAISGLARAVTRQRDAVSFSVRNSPPVGTRRPYTSPRPDRDHRGAEPCCLKPRFPTPISTSSREGCGLSFSGCSGRFYFPGHHVDVADDMPFLDGELSRINGVVTVRALAKLTRCWPTTAVIDDTRLLSSDAMAGMKGKAELWRI